MQTLDEEADAIADLLIAEFTEFLTLELAANAVKETGSEHEPITLAGARKH